jgi:hypothetical protein
LTEYVVCTNVYIIVMIAWSRSANDPREVVESLLAEMSVNTPGSTFERSLESDAIWKRAIIAQMTELQSKVFRMIVIASKLNCR